MKFYLYYLAIILFLLCSCDTIDNLDQIAGIEDFGLVIINPATNSFQEIGDECQIEWKLAATKARKVKIELIDEEKNLEIITQETINNGLFLWENISGLPGERCVIRITILGGVYSGKYGDSGFFNISTPPGYVWLEPVDVKIRNGCSFELKLYINTGNQRLAAYGIDIGFDPSVIDVDKSAGDKGVVYKEKEFSGAINADIPGLLRIAGFDVYGLDPDDAIHLLTISWTSSGKGSTEINIDIRDLTDNLKRPIKKPQGTGTKITVY